MHFFVIQGIVLVSLAMSTHILKKVSVNEVKGMYFDPVDGKAREQAAAILADLKADGMDGLLSNAVRLGDIKSKEDKVMYTPAELKAAFDALSETDQQVLQRTADRIRAFAEAQRKALRDTTVAIPGGEAGHFVEPVACAGCYAPGGRYPLPSSVLMTALTARAAGVTCVYVASPRPAPATLAAAHLAKADGLLAVGGAQAIGGMAYGIGCPPCDVIVGPGNRVRARNQPTSQHMALPSSASSFSLLSCTMINDVKLTLTLESLFSLRSL